MTQILLSGQIKRSLNVIVMSLMGQKQPRQNFTKILQFLYTFVIRVLYTYSAKRFLKRT